MYSVEQRIKILKYAVRLWKDIYENNLDSKHVSQYYNYEHSINATEFICNYGSCKECDMYASDKDFCLIFNFENVSNKKEVSEKIYKKYKTLLDRNITKEYIMMTLEDTIKILKYGKKLWKDVYQNNLCDKGESKYFEVDKAMNAFLTVCDFYDDCKKCTMFSGSANECILAEFNILRNMNKRKEAAGKIYKKYKNLIKELQHNTEYLGCGSNSCIVEKPNVGTNSGCACFKDLPTKERLKIEKIIHRLKSKLSVSKSDRVDLWKSL